MAPKTPRQLRRRYLSRPPVEPMRLRKGMTVVDLVDVYRRAGAFNGGRLAEGADLFGRMIDSGATIALTVTGALGLPGGTPAPLELPPGSAARAGRARSRAEAAVAIRFMCPPGALRWRRRFTGS